MRLEASYRVSAVVHGAVLRLQRQPIPNIPGNSPKKTVHPIRSISQRDRKISPPPSRNTVPGLHQLGPHHVRDTEGKRREIPLRRTVQHRFEVHSLIHVPPAVSGVVKVPERIYPDVVKSRKARVNFQPGKPGQINMVKVVGGSSSIPQTPRSVRRHLRGGILPQSNEAKIRRGRSPPVRNSGRGKHQNHPKAEKKKPWPALQSIHVSPSTNGAKERTYDPRSPCPKHKHRSQKAKKRGTAPKKSPQFQEVIFSQAMPHKRD